MRPGVIPVGDQYHATIRTGSLEEVLQDENGNIKFPTFSSAILHAKREIARIRSAPAAPMTQAEIDAKAVLDWKREKAEELIRDRSAFDLINVQVVHKKRRRRG